MKYLWANDAEEFWPERRLNENGISSRKAFSNLQPSRQVLESVWEGICLQADEDILHDSVRKIQTQAVDEKKKVNYRRMLTLNIEGGLPKNI
ncbi:cytochrome P450 [Melia azedarach]|uniref:Cytochrome P450 n=1 Tax=Melia azedarach TaxID=155640 RepID=A0ACC1X3Y7_MELAZ|nr:cytochrome P450 [Melia azedarach]